VAHNLLFVACIASLLVTDLVWILVPQPVLIGLILAIATTVGGAFNVVFGSIRQRIVPNHLLGRVMASFRVISWGSIPLGALLGGIIGQAFGLTAVFLSAAAIHFRCAVDSAQLRACPRRYHAQLALGNLDKQIHRAPVTH